MWGFRVRAPGGPPIHTAGVAQLARALAFQAGGRGFEPRFPLKKSKKCECSSVVRMSPCQGEGRGFDSHHSLKQISVMNHTKMPW